MSESRRLAVYAQQTPRFRSGLRVPPAAQVQIPRDWLGVGYGAASKDKQPKEGGGAGGERVKAIFDTAVSVGIPALLTAIGQRGPRQQQINNLNAQLQAMQAQQGPQGFPQGFHANSSSPAWLPWALAGAGIVVVGGIATYAYFRKRGVS